MCSKRQGAEKGESVCVWGGGGGEVGGGGVNSATPSTANVPKQCD